MIFVKLHQFDEADQVRLSLQTPMQSWQKLSAGVEIMSLHQHQQERVELVRLQPGAVMDLEPLAAIEGYLLEGEVAGNELLPRLSAGSWWRTPRLQTITARQPSLMWLKSGHFELR